MDKETRKVQNSFGVLWNIFSNISGVIGLVSLTDDIIAWKKFIPQLIETYRKIVYFPFNLFNIHLNDHLIDYLFLGALCGASYIKALTFGINTNLLSSRGTRAVKIVYFVIYLLLWPFGLIISLKQVLIKEDDEAEKMIKLTFLQWLGVLLFLFILVLVLNQLL